MAIDPGNEQSAFCWYADDEQKPYRFGKWPNAQVLDMLERESTSCLLAIEMIASYGMPVGREVFETCVWIGRFVQAWQGDHALVYRREVKLHLCGQPRAKDANIRQALIDRWGGKDRAVGKKASPGPLYGVSADVWSALAIAVTYVDTRQVQA